ncbi:MAG: hypothetical protein K6E86_09010 [Bacteroidales bacterium]|nr:hypothetical protein [Bacteroidales bacterium]
MKKVYISPQVEVIHLEMEGVVCDSLHSIVMGGRSDDFLAPENRRSQAWDDYENGN